MKKLIFTLILLLITLMLNGCNVEIFSNKEKNQKITELENNIRKLKDKEEELKKEEMESNKEFLLDIIKAIEELYISTERNKYYKSDNENYSDDDIYKFFLFSKEHILAAKKNLEKWKENKDSFKRNLSEDLFYIVEKYIIANDIMLQEESSKKDLERSKVEQGLAFDKFSEVISKIIGERPFKKLKLNENQKKEIINYVNIHFKKELETIIDYKGKVINLNEAIQSINDMRVLFITLIIHNLSE